MQIVIKGFVGLAGAAKAAAGQEALWADFPKRFRRHWDELTEAASDRNGAEDMLPPDAVPLSHGLFQALWLLGAREESGLKVCLSLVPVRQEVIELCESLELNPYRIAGSGYLTLREGMPEEGETVIGWLTEDKRRIVEETESIRYLTKPERGY